MVNHKPTPARANGTTRSSNNSHSVLSATKYTSSPITANVPATIATAYQLGGSVSDPNILSMGSHSRTVSQVKPTAATTTKRTLGKARCRQFSLSLLPLVIASL